MKTYLLTLTGLLTITTSATLLGADARLSEPDGRTRAYIDDRGRISAPDGKTLGYVESDGRISKPDGSTAGYLDGPGDAKERLRPDRGDGPAMEKRRRD